MSCFRILKDSGAKTMSEAINLSTSGEERGIQEFIDC